MFKYLLLGVAAAAALADECAISNADKIDCGYSGMTEAECEANGCCYQPVYASSASGTPWCYHKAGFNANCFIAQTDMSDLYTEAEVSTMRSYYLANMNIDNKGGVVAAPDYDTPGGSYYYHWMRDAALTMRSLQETSSNFTDYEAIMKNYVQWVLHVQSEADPNGQDVRTEPKFMLPNGEVFSDPWCRPQNDGPGLRATALIMFANTLINVGQREYVTTYMWTSNGNYNGGAIKYDLDYIISGYATSTCDLWEEIRSTDFFWNRYTMNYALKQGATFATLMGDSTSATSYTNTANTIMSTLYNNHWNGQFVLEDVTRTKDSAVIVGFNVAYLAEDKVFAPTSYEVASTVYQYNNLFCSEYAVNQEDTKAGTPGVLYGRYQGDTYAGGNPWVLSTAALAQLLYRAASSVLNGAILDATTLAQWSLALNTEMSSTPTTLAHQFASAADGVMERLKQHVEPENLHLYEQIDRNTGEQMSASDLTWSYAEMLNALHQRDVYLSTSGAMKH